MNLRYSILKAITLGTPIVIYTSIKAENAPELNTTDSILKAVEQCSPDLDLTKVTIQRFFPLFYLVISNA